MLLSKNCNANSSIPNNLSSLLYANLGIIKCFLDTPQPNKYIVDTTELLYFSVYTYILVILFLHCCENCKLCTKNVEIFKSWPLGNVKMNAYEIIFQAIRESATWTYIFLENVQTKLLIFVFILNENIF